MVQLGYACINTELSAQGITTNRSMIKRTFQERGLPYASELALANARDLVEIIKWNHKNGINVFRMSSEMFPWMSEYEFKDLPDYQRISNVLSGAGKLAKSYGQRLSFHPGPFNVLASPNPDVVTKTIKELRQHAEVMDMLGLPQSNMAKINIHVGGAYGDKPGTLSRFCKNFDLLPDNVKSRLVIENDDKPNLYSVKDLVEGIHNVIGIPINFDYLHHSFNTGGLSTEQAAKLAYSTWPCKPCFHYSESRQLFEDSGAKPQAHTDWYYGTIETFGLDVDIMCEVKMKEAAVLKYLEKPIFS